MIFQAIDAPGSRRESTADVVGVAHPPGLCAGLLNQGHDFLRSGPHLAVRFPGSVAAVSRGSPTGSGRADSARSTLTRSRWSAWQSLLASVRGRLLSTSPGERRRPMSCWPCDWLIWFRHDRSTLGCFSLVVAPAAVHRLTSGVWRRGCWGGDGRGTAWLSPCAGLAAGRSRRRRAHFRAGVQRRIGRGERDAGRAGLRLVPV